jgi:hypothetical protein
VAIGIATLRVTRGIACTSCRTPQGRRSPATCRTKCQEEHGEERRGVLMGHATFGPLSAHPTAARTRSPIGINSSPNAKQPRSLCPAIRSPLRNHPLVRPFYNPTSRVALLIVSEPMPRSAQDMSAISAITAPRTAAGVRPAQKVRVRAHPYFASLASALAVPARNGEGIARAGRRRAGWGRGEGEFHSRDVRTRAADV